MWEASVLVRMSPCEKIFRITLFKHNIPWLWISFLVVQPVVLKGFWSNNFLRQFKALPLKQGFLLEALVSTTFFLTKHLRQQDFGSSLTQSLEVDRDAVRKGILAITNCVLSVAGRHITYIPALFSSPIKPKYEGVVWVAKCCLWDNQKENRAGP